MHLLYHWTGQNYAADLDEGAAWHLNQGNPLLHEVLPGESVWAFTRRPDGVYALAAELVVRARTRNAPGYRYGPYRVWADTSLSRYFATPGQEGLETLVRDVLSPKARAAVLGRAFQGHAAVRRLTRQDHEHLRVFAADLALEPRAHQVPPEAALEAGLHRGTEDYRRQLVSWTGQGMAEPRRQYLVTTAYDRNRTLVAWLQYCYKGRCQLCEWRPRRVYDHDLCEAHHLQWLSRGGPDELSNLMLLCPNHHRAVHACDAVLDYSDLSMDFGVRREPVRLFDHLVPAS